MQHGDFVKIDFIGRVAGSGEMFDVTLADVARKHRIHDPARQYAPALVVIGAHMVIPGVEKQLLKMKPGEEQEFTVPATEAFGPRIPRLVKVLPLPVFLKNSLNPLPGTFVEVEGLRGRVQSVSGGRVRVDFNHPLAGKDLRYWVRITEEVTDAAKKVQELFSHYGLSVEPALREGVLTVSSEKETGHEVKAFIREITTKWVKDVRDIRFTATSGQQSP